MSPGPCQDCHSCGRGTAKSQDPHRPDPAHAPLGLCLAEYPREPVNSGSSKTPFQSTSWRTSRLTHRPHPGAQEGRRYRWLRLTTLGYAGATCGPPKTGAGALGKAECSGSDSVYHFHIRSKIGSNLVHLFQQVMVRFSGESPWCAPNCASIFGPFPRCWGISGTRHSDCALQPS